MVSVAAAPFSQTLSWSFLHGRGRFLLHHDQVRDLARIVSLNLFDQNPAECRENFLAVSPLYAALMRERLDQSRRARHGYGRAATRRLWTLRGNSYGRARSHFQMLLSMNMPEQLIV